MDALLIWTGRLLGTVGLGACLLAVALRAGQNYWIGAIQVGTLLQAGIAMTAGACFLLLLVVTRSDRRRG
jgi:hypothetical protein